MKKIIALLSFVVLCLVATLGWILYLGRVPTINPQSKNVSAKVEQPPALAQETNPQLQAVGSVLQPLPAAALEVKPQPQTVSTKVQQPQALDSCGIPIDLHTTDFQVLASGTYDGVSARSGGEFFVNVEPSSKPIVLLLSGYEMLTWNVQLPLNHQVKAIAITGYHRQRAVVSDPNVPVAIASYDQSSLCYTDGFKFDDLKKANQVSQKMYRKPISMFYPPTSKGAVTIASIDTISPPAVKNPITIQQVASPPIDGSEPSKLMADTQGIQQAIALGLIRAATERDVEKYLEAYETFAAPSGSILALPPIYGGQKPSNSTQRVLRRNSGYVILKNMRMPEGMGGAHAVTFILPPGVPYPKGELGHSILLNMNDGSCTGAAQMLCDRS
jgi:hypothetical protein